MPDKFTTAKKMLLKLLALLFLGYAGLCLLLFVAQRKLIHLPSRTNNILPAGFEPWLITNTSGGTEFTGFKRIAKFSSNAPSTT